MNALNLQVLSWMHKPRMNAGWLIVPTDIAPAWIEGDVMHEQWTKTSDDWLQRNRLSLRNKRLKFKTAGGLPVVLEEVKECIFNPWPVSSLWTIETCIYPSTHICMHSSSTIIGGKGLIKLKWMSTVCISTVRPSLSPTGLINGLGGI
jgi:hypothetical protein